MKQQLEYINLGYKPKKDEVICEYFVEPNGISLEEACENIAAESSIGTWTTIATMNKNIATKLKPKVFSINKRTNEIKIAYPEALFEEGNMPEILSSIAGNIFGMKVLKNLRLQDIEFPKSIIKSFKGPKFGIKGIRRLLKVRERPLIGTIVKPKVGLTPDQHAEVAYNAWSGGLDIVKDDENLSSMKFNKFETRIKQTLRLRDKAEKETGEKKIYMPNITAETNEMLRRADIVKKYGGEYIMVDIITVGWGALQTVREADLGMVIHAHRAMHAAITKNPKHGISMLAIAKIARLIGVDQLHIGAVVGKMVGGAEEVFPIGEEIEDRLVHPMDVPTHRLEQSWYGMKPVFAVCSGGLYPGAIPSLMKAMGNNIIIQAGGGCHGHPDGTKHGATAMRQAVEASMKKIPLIKYAQHHVELHKAIQKWGIKK
jgi:ribulose-bisphosphate carboxylase large chain